MKTLPLSLAFAACWLSASSSTWASPARARRASPAQARLVPLERTVAFPAPADSNSPVYWNDLNELVLFTSVGFPQFSVGPDLTRLTTVGEAGFDVQIPGGRWLESVIRAGDSTLYGYYHHEAADPCPGTDLTEPKIGAAVSLDDGQTWRDLGIVISAPEGYMRCDTANAFFAGGVGDFTAILDQEQRYVYFFYTAYAGAPGEQGVSVARLPWAERDRPEGRVSKYFDGLWLEPGLGGRNTAIFPALPLWEDTDTDSFWGPSVHWNTALQSYVMLLNHNQGPFFRQEGVYMAFSSNLEDPWQWSAPEQIIRGGGWYPQVIGLEDSRGTDRVAGGEAWLCVTGQCQYRILFEAALDPQPASRAGVITRAPAARGPIQAAAAPERPRRRRKG
jgi:hypothetical protein